MSEDALFDTPSTRSAQPKKEKFTAETPNGTPLNLAVSALIKSLRRGNELEALFWAKQIESRYWAYLWRRLLIFASEDVNIGNPDAVVQVRALYDNYVTVKEGSKNPVVDRSIVTMAIMILARSEKSRECDDLLNVIEHLQNQYGWEPALRDEVFDLHTVEGKQRWPRKFRLRHWLESASKEWPRVGPLDWHLWLLKWGAQRGVYDVAWVEERARKWNDDGRLRYGIDGMVQSRVNWMDVEHEFDDLIPASPRVDPVGMPLDIWVWTCPACRAPLDKCSLTDPCCDDCDHAEILFVMKENP